MSPTLALASEIGILMLKNLLHVGCKNRLIPELWRYDRVDIWVFDLHKKQESAKIQDIRIFQIFRHLGRKCNIFCPELSLNSEKSDFLGKFFIFQDYFKIGQDIVVSPLFWIQQRGWSNSNWHFVKMVFLSFKDRKDICSMCSSISIQKSLQARSSYIQNLNASFIQTHDS